MLMPTGLEGKERKAYIKANVRVLQSGRKPRVYPNKHIGLRKSKELIAAEAEVEEERLAKEAEVEEERLAKEAEADRRAALSDEERAEEDVILAQLIDDDAASSR